MACNSTLLCIHRSPARLSLLRENGYRLLTATNGRHGLQVLMSCSVDAIVLEYHLGLLNGSVIAAEIKQVRPELPIVMWAEHTELPEGALKCVDALLPASDPPHFLWAAVHFVLNVKPPGRRLMTRKTGTFAGQDFQLAIDTLAEKAAPFSPTVWRSILTGTVQF